MERTPTPILTRRLEALRVGYLIVHPELLQAPALARVESLLARPPGLVAVDGPSDLRLYRVRDDDVLR